jgi:hypothetical protein
MVLDLEEKVAAAVKNLKERGQDGLLSKSGRIVPHAG